MGKSTGTPYKRPPRPGEGRPSDYTPEKAEYICEQVAHGRIILDIIKDEGMPGLTTFFRWLAAHDEFRNKYRDARDIQAQLMADELKQIADDGRNDTYTDEKGNERVAWDVIKRSELRVSTRMWLMSKMMPKKYGDSQSIQVAGQVAIVGAQHVTHAITLVTDKDPAEPITIEANEPDS
jgi:hypothetical protein